MWSSILELEGSLKSEVGLGKVVCTGAAGRERAQCWQIRPENASPGMGTGSDSWEHFPKFSPVHLPHPEHLPIRLIPVLSRVGEE